MPFLSREHLLSLASQPAQGGALWQRVVAGLARRKALLADTSTTCLRLLDAGSDEALLDVYGQDLVLQLGAPLPQAGAEAALAVALERGSRLASVLGERLQARAVWLKLRPPQTNTLVDAVRLGLTPALPVYGKAPPRRLAELTGQTMHAELDNDALPGDQWVLENGVLLRVGLGRGLPTGLYLDLRNGRRLLQQEAKGLRVLNTFAYTCGVQVAAAVGGAVRTLSIDAAQPALDEGHKSLQANGVSDPGAHTQLRGDVLAVLPRLARRGERFDWVVLDPPSYAKVKERRFSVLHDYPELVALAAQVLVPGGRLLACANHLELDHKKLERLVRAGLGQAGRTVVNVTQLAPQVDFEAGRAKGLVVGVD